MNEEQAPEDLIRYDVLTQEALREVIRKVLDEVAATGLPGDHHFFITFRTDHPGVRLSARMRERYSEEMTIVIQHSYWDLKVSDSGFEIDLSFDDILERLKIPFAALKGFFDPHVKFGVQFDTSHLEAANSDGDTHDVSEVTTQNPVKSSVPQLAQTRAVTKPPTKTKAGKAAKKSTTKSANKTAAPAKQPAESAEIVSLDKFRKKK